MRGSQLSIRTAFPAALARPGLSSFPMAHIAEQRFDTCVGRHTVVHNEFEDAGITAFANQTKLCPAPGCKRLLS
jgi:hypothetical protein